MQNKKDLLQSEKEVSKKEKRIEELNVIIKKLYEDNVLGKLSDERFVILSQDYEKEQKVLKENIINTKNSINTFKSKKCNFDKFTNIIQKYTDIKELKEKTINDQ